jgi:nucleoside-diphosphate-sugar epimerase
MTRTELNGADIGTHALVTGGGGFLGSAIARRLKELGLEVRTFSRGDYPDLAAAGIEHVRGDLADPASVAEAAQGCDVVFHVAARAGVGGPYEQYYRPNVTGTECVLAACDRHGIKKLVYTSSPSVVFHPGDMENVDESLPYATDFKGAHYPKTKAIAEQAVLAANSPALATVALRPHLIWGPGDNHLVPRIVSRAKAGKLRRIGDGTNRVDSVYIDDAAEAHVQAAAVLEPGSAVAGRAYFVTQDESVPCWDLVNGILEAAGVPPLTKAISKRVAYAAGWTLERYYRAFKPEAEPPMTRFVAMQLSTTHTFDISAAKRDFGYAPSLTIAEGLARLKKSFEEQAAACGS